MLANHRDDDGERCDAAFGLMFRGERPRPGRDLDWFFVRVARPICRRAPVTEAPFGCRGHVTDVPAA